MDALIQSVIQNNVAELEKSLKPQNFANLTKQSNFSIPKNAVQTNNLNTEVKSALPYDSLTLLHIAAFFDSLEAFIYLINNDMSFRQKSAASYYPLHYACLAGSYEVVHYILDNDPFEAQEATQTEFSLIYLATFSCNPDILRLLIENGANINDEVCKRNNPIEHAIKTVNIEILKILLNAGSKSSFDSYHYSSLMQAVINRAEDAVPLLIQHGERPEYVATDSQTALSLACFLCLRKTVKYLCSHMTSVDIDPKVQEKAAVHWICSSKDPEIVRMVLQKGINVNRLDRDGHSGVFYLLDLANEDDTINILEQLVNAGLDLNLRCKSIQGEDTNTILGDFVTAIYRPIKVIDWLLAHGANPYAKLQISQKSIYESVKKIRNRELLKTFNKYVKDNAQPKEPENLHKPYVPITGSSSNKTCVIRINHK